MATVCQGRAGERARRRIDSVDDTMSDPDRPAPPAAPPGWEDLGDRWRRRFEFADFAEAWAFMGRVAEHAEALGHHPDWSNSWNRVTIELTTHDAGGITELDAQLAAAIDRST